MTKNKKGIFTDPEIIEIVRNRDLCLVITVGEYQDKWYSSSNCCISTKPRRGFVFPLNDKCTQFKTREDALYNEFCYVDTWLKSVIKEHPGYKKYDKLILIWNEPKQMELF